MKTLTTPDEIRALPEGTVLLDDQGDVWQRRGFEWLSYERSPESSEVLATRYSPLVILSPSQEAPDVSSTELEDEKDYVGFELALRIAAVTNAARAWGVLAGAGGAERGVEILTQSLNTRAEWLNEYLEATFGVSLPEL